MRAGEQSAGVELDRLVQRLRRLSAREWSADGRSGLVRGLARSLAAIGAPGHELPDGLPDHALPDVVAVLGADALAAPGATDEVAQLSRSITIAMP